MMISIMMTTKIMMNIKNMINTTKIMVMMIVHMMERSKALPKSSQIYI